jgi:hypothetical protein
MFRSLIELKKLENAFTCGVVLAVTGGVPCNGIGAAGSASCAVVGPPGNASAGPADKAAKGLDMPGTIDDGME